MGILVSWSGTEPGQLNDANAIGLDGEGHIYVGEEESRRVQVFSAAGEFLEQWRIEQDEASLRKMTVARDGTVYIVANGNIYKYVGLTGELLGQMEYSGGQGFQDVAVTAYGGLVASWNRDWRGGLFTNFNESQDDIVIFDREGNVDLVIAKALSEVAGGDPELDTLIAVDAEGNIYATGSLNAGIFKFSPEGKFVDKYVDERLNFILDMAVDEQGRLFVAASGDILVFDESGAYVDLIDASPTGLVFADDGTLIVVDDPQILKFGINR
jgi:DNA-binding beta-propeller fold protein YncE